MAYRIGQVGDFVLYAPTYKDVVEARHLLEDDPQQRPETLSMVEALVCDRRPAGVGREPGIASEGARHA